MRKTFSITNQMALDKLDSMKDGEKSQYIQDLIMKDILSTYGGVGFEKSIEDVLRNVIMQVDMIKKNMNEMKKL